MNEDPKTLEEDGSRKFFAGASGLGPGPNSKCSRKEFDKKTREILQQIEDYYCVVVDGRPEDSE